nr:MAG TPA: hypothetical protein [Caudoviricetes sp.]
MLVIALIVKTCSRAFDIVPFVELNNRLEE